MYEVYLGGMLLPVTPEKISMRIGNRNQTASLINEGEINILKAAGLTEISFTALIPQVKYPFARYEAGTLVPASVYLEHLEALKGAREPFRFIVSRFMPRGSRLFDTNLGVSLEDYSVQESARQGFDLEIDIRLKQYRSYGTKTVEMDVEIPELPVAVTENRPVTTPTESPSSSSSGGSSKKKTSLSEKMEKAKEKTEKKAAAQAKAAALIKSVTEKVQRTVTKPASTSSMGGGKTGHVQLMMTR